MIFIKTLGAISGQGVKRIKLEAWHSSLGLQHSKPSWMDVFAEVLRGNYDDFLFENICIHSLTISYVFIVYFGQNRSCSCLLLCS